MCLLKSAQFSTRHMFVAIQQYWFSEILLLGRLVVDVVGNLWSGMC